MNIFVLDKNPVLAAQAHSDIHVNKMIIESAQMLSTNYRILLGTECKVPSKSGKTMRRHWKLDNETLEELVYKPAHFNHPCTIWARKTTGNWQWLYELYSALCDEYYYRRGKCHASSMFLDLFARPPEGLLDLERTDFCVAMDQYPHCKVPGDPVQSYRNYYNDQKLKFATYTRRQPPEWLNL